MYATKTDLLEQLPEPELLDLTDDVGDGIVNDQVVARALADAAAVIDAHCQGRYPVPLAPAPPMVRRLAVDLAVYHLYSRKMAEVPEARKDRYKAALAFLGKVAEGRISLGAAQPAPSASGAELVAGNPRVFKRGLGL